MLKDPAVLKAPNAVRACPACGNKGHKVVLESRDGQPACQAVYCSACSLDLLQVYRWLEELKPRTSPPLTFNRLTQFLALLFGG
jgi:hypothetical protein